MAELELFRQTIDQLHRDLVYLLLYFQGEPYLNKQFLEMASYAEKKGVYTATSTNGHYLNDENARKTIESGISEVTISIDGTTQDTYEAYRVGGKLDKVLEGVKNLVHWRDKLGSQTPFIIIQFLVVRPNEHQTDEIKQLGKELGVDKVTLKTAQIYDYEEGSELIPEQDKFSRYRKKTDGSWELKNRLDNQCWKLWLGAEITWDGKVLPCCFDKDAQYQMGSLKEKSFKEIWRSPQFDDFRNRLLQSRKEIDICRNCSEGTKVFGS
jgi:radical SAM protein with 4Fe4S-binding SPASM domain